MKFLPHFLISVLSAGVIFAAELPKRTLQYYGENETFTIDGIENKNPYYLGKLLSKGA